MFGGSSKPHCANQPISLKFKRSSLSPFSFLFFPPFPDPSPLNLQYPVPHLSLNFNTFSFAILIIHPKHRLLPSRIPPPLTSNIQFLISQSISTLSPSLSSQYTPKTPLTPFPDSSPLNLQYPIPHLSFNFNTFSFTILTIPPKHLLLPSRIPPPLTFNSSSKSGAKQSAYPPCILCTQRKKINAAQRGPQGALPQERSEARTPVLEE